MNFNLGKFFKQIFNFRDKQKVKSNELLSKSKTDIKESFSPRPKGHYHRSRFIRVFNKWARAEAGESSPWSLKTFGTFSPIKRFNSAKLIYK